MLFRRRLKVKGFIFTAPTSDVKDYEPKVIVSAELTHQQEINRGFSSWDGSHIQLVKIVKMTMNDASSFEHVKTSYWDNNDGTINVLMKYRGKNGFGAKVLGSIKVKADIENGNVLGEIQ